MNKKLRMIATQNQSEHGRFGCLKVFPRVNLFDNLLITTHLKLKLRKWEKSDPEVLILLRFASANQQVCYLLPSFHIASTH